MSPISFKSYCVDFLMSPCIYLSSKTRKIGGLFYGDLFKLLTILEKSQNQGEIDLNEEMHSMTTHTKRKINIPLLIGL